VKSWFNGYLAFQTDRQNIKGALFSNFAVWRSQAVCLIATSHYETWTSLRLKSWPVLQEIHTEGECCVQPQRNSVLPGEEYFQICAGALWGSLASPGLHYSAKHPPSGQSAFVCNVLFFEKKCKLKFDHDRICLLIVATESKKRRPWSLVQNLCHWRKAIVWNF
jgi:hypothetical protein